MFCVFVCLLLLRVKLNARTLHEAHGFQFQFINGCKHEVVIAACVGTRERSCVCFVDAGLEALGCRDGVCLVVNLPIRGMPGCCPRQLMGVESVCKSESAALCELWKSSSSVGCLSNAKSSYCPCAALVCVRAYLGISIALNYRYILLGSLCYDTVKLLIELFDPLVFMV